MPTEKKLDLGIGEAHAMEDNAGANAQGVSGPPGKVGTIFDRIEFVHMGGGHAEGGFNNRSGDVTGSAVVVAINAEWNGVPETDQPGESLNDPHAAGNVARSREASVAGMLALFTVLPVFLRTVLYERAADRRAGGIKCEDLINGNEYLVVRQEAKVDNAE